MSSSRRWSGSTGSTTDGCSSRSATYRSPSSRVSLGLSRPRTIQSDSRSRVSTEPGAIHKGSCADPLRTSDRLVMMGMHVGGRRRGSSTRLKTSEDG